MPGEQQGASPTTALNQPMLRSLEERTGSLINSIGAA